MNRKSANIQLLRTFLPAMALVGSFVLGITAADAAQKYQYAPRLCTDCHGLPPGDSNVTFRNVTTGAVRGNHLTHAINAQSSCEKCHTGSTFFGTDHSDGLIFMADNINASPLPAKGRYSKAVSPAFFNQTSNPVPGTCTNINCHFEKETPVWSSATFASPGNCDKCHGAPPAGSADAPGTAGSHAKHDSYYNGAGHCVKCHTDHTAEAKPFAHATSQRNIVVAPRDPAGSLAGSYSGSGANFLPSQQASQSFGTCSGTYCHSDGQATSGPYSHTAIQWGGSAGCTTCHGWAGTSTTLSGRHLKHINTDTYSFSCNYCHNATTTDGFTISSTRPSLHVNMSKDVTFAPEIRTTGSTWSSGGCADIYCHGNGQSLTSTGSGTWNGATSNCWDCHAHTVLSTGSHTRHIPSETGSSSCTKCHNSTVSSGGMGGILFPEELSNRRHVNRAVDIKLNAGFAESTPRYNGTDIATNYSKTPGTAYARCSGLYCHSDGKRNAAYRSYSSKQWGSTNIGCNSCHGTNTSIGVPSYTNYSNSHAKHASVATDCVKCHFKTTTTGTTIIGGTLSHVDGSILVNLSNSLSFTDYSGVYDGATRKCFSTYCHGGSNTTPAWGGTTDCNSCHKSDNTLPGAHALHTKAATSYAAPGGNIGTTNTVNFSCASCHGNVPGNHVNGPVTGGSDATIFFGFSSAGRNPAYARTGTLHTDPRGFKWMDGTTGVCVATYCHSDGAGHAGSYATFNWGSAPGSIGCTGCHDGAGGSTKLSGKHKEHVFACNYCHFDTTNDGSVISDKSLHVNKIKDIRFDPAIRATTTTWDGSQCVNTCHSGGSLLLGTW